MPDKLAEARARLSRIEAGLLEMEDALDRLQDLIRVGALAAEGMHGLGDDPAASALVAWFDVLADAVEEVRGLGPGSSIEKRATPAIG